MRRYRHTVGGQQLQLPLRIERQLNRVADPVSAVLAVAGPVLLGTLQALRNDRLERLGGLEAVTLQDLAREFRAGDGDYGICFEYAVHDAIGRGDPLIAERVAGVLQEFCSLREETPRSILFGGEKSGAQRLIATSTEILTPESSVWLGQRGRPPRLRDHLETALHDFRHRKGPTLLPSSIAGLWKADLFVGGTQNDKWVATSVKVKERSLEAADGIRLGIVPREEGSDVPFWDDARNLIVLPLPYDGEFVEVFSRAFDAVRQLLVHDAQVPPPIALPNAADREVARKLAERAEFPVVELVTAISSLAQPDLLESKADAVDLTSSDSQGLTNEGELETGAMLAPVSMPVE